MDTGPGRGGLSPFYRCCGILLLFGKVVYLRHLICAHYSLVRAWLLNVWDVYVASSVVQALPLRRTWVNSLQSRRGQSALQQTDRNAEGCNLVFLPFPARRFLQQGEGRKMQHTVLVGEKFTGLLVIQMHREVQKPKRQRKEVEKEEERWESSPA